MPAVQIIPEVEEYTKRPYDSTNTTPPVFRPEGDVQTGWRTLTKTYDLDPVFSYFIKSYKMEQMRKIETLKKTISPLFK